jgi:hypothetical protein
VADEATERVRTMLQLTDRIRVNGARPGVIDRETSDLGFTVWFWSVFPAHPGGEPANAALIELNSPEFPGAGATLWQNPTATVAIPEVFFYSTGVFIPVTFRPLDVTPARPAQAEVEQDGQAEHSFSRMDIGSRLVRKITVNGTRTDPTIAYPPPGSPTRTAPEVPQHCIERGKNWGRGSVKLTSARHWSGYHRGTPEEPA